MKAAGVQRLIISMLLSNKQPVKRLVVRNFKGQKLPEDFESNSWEVLRVGITAIMTGQEPSTCLEVLYRTCENMVRCNMANNLYAKVYELIDQLSSQFALEHVPRISGLQEAGLLQETSAVWTVFCQRLRMSENVLMYLDRCHILQRPELMSIHALGVSMFKQYFLQASGLFDVLKRTLLQSIGSIRASKTLGDTSLQKNLVFLLVDTGMFSLFEPELSKETSTQYQKDIVSIDFKSYESVQVVAFWLLFEEQLGTKLGFPRETKKMLLKIVEELVLIDSLESLVASGLPVLVENLWKQDALDIVPPPMNEFNELQKSPSDTLFELRLLIGLAQRANGADILKANWSKFVKSYGAMLLASKKSDEMIDELLLFKKRLEAVLADVFNKEASMENAMKEAFESFLNARASKLAELISKYFDVLLREGKVGNVVERLSDEEIVQVIDRVIILFRLLQSKEAIEAFYKQFLAKRLLQNRSISIDLEKEVVKRFKTECGAAFTSRLESMFKDVDSVAELNRAFHQESGLKQTSIDVSITVVSSGIWPHVEDVHVKLPKAITEAQDAFGAYYDQKHNGRRLVWNQNMGYCVVKAPFPNGTKELQVSIPQAMVLDCFNAAETVSVGDVLKQTKIAPETLQETLESLSTGRHKILIKNRASEKPSKSDTYSYNAAFTSRLVRIRLNTSSGREAVEAAVAQAAPFQIEDLQYRIDAALISTIKPAGKMQRDQLVRLALAKLNLPSIPSAEVEKRMDILISRDFIGKDPKDANQLSYVP